jgi:hypothetical protein
MKRLSLAIVLTLTAMDVDTPHGEAVLAAYRAEIAAIRAGK